jgi:hypothetical protein
MQHVLQKYILRTCHKSAQSGPPIVCFHPIQTSHKIKKFSGTKKFLVVSGVT